jgi:hypothetical protein
MAFLGLQKEDQKEEEEEGGPTTKKRMNAFEWGRRRRWGTGDGGDGRWNRLKTSFCVCFYFLPSDAATDVSGRAAAVVVVIGVNQNKTSRKGKAAQISLIQTNNFFSLFFFSLFSE